MGVLVVCRAVARRGRGGLVGLAAITALVLGFALTAANGARRTETAWPRLLDNNRAGDFMLSVAPDEAERVVKVVGARSDVSAVGAFSWMPATPREANGPGSEQIGIYAAIGPGFGDTAFRPTIERGRRADGTRADEITINEALADLTGLDVGDETVLVGLGPGADQPATVVGIHRSALDVGPNGGAPAALGTSAFMARWWPYIQQFDAAEFLRPSIAVRIAPGAEVESVMAGVAEMLPDAGLITPEELNADVEQGYSTQATAYLVLAVASAVGGTVLVILLASRLLRVRRDGPEVLAAIGMTRAERWLATGLPVALAVAAGTLVAPLVATLASPLVRTGFTAAADPIEGIWVDGPRLAVATAGLLVVLAAGVAIVSWSASGFRGRRGTPPPRPAVFARAAGPSAAAAVGLAIATGGMTISARRLARSTLAAVTVGTAAVVAAGTWATSANSLADDHMAQGWTSDVYIAGSPGTATEEFARARDALSGMGGVREFVPYRRSITQVGRADVDVFAFEGAKGLHPTILDGRAPATASEVAIGLATARRLDVAVGDRVEVAGTAGSQRLTVVGTAIYPYIGNASYGETLSMTAEAFDEIGLETLEGGFLVDANGRPNLERLQAAVGESLSVLPPTSAPAVTRLRDATGIDAALAAFFAAITLVLAAAGLYATSRRHTGDHAVLRAIGFVRGDVRTAHSVHALAISVFAAIVGLPLGVAIGSAAWKTSTEGLIALERFDVSIALLAVVATVLTVVSFGAARWAARLPMRMNLARALRSE